MPRPGALVVKNGSPMRASTSLGHARAAVADRDRRARVGTSRRRTGPTTTAALAGDASCALVTSERSAWLTARGGSRSGARASVAGTSRCTRGASRMPTSVSSSSSATVHAVDALADRAGALRHLLEDRAAAPDLLADQARVGGELGRCRALVSARSSSFAASATVPSGVDSSCAAPAAIVASEASRSCRAASPRASVSSRSRSASAPVMRRRKCTTNADATPSATHAPIARLSSGIASGWCATSRMPNADERQPDEHPRPARAEQHRRERDLHEVEEAERVVRPAGQVQEPGQDRDVEHHQQRDLPLVHRRAAAHPRAAGRRRSTARCARFETSPTPITASSDAIGSAPVEQELPDEHGRRLPRDLAPSAGARATGC